MAVKVFTIDMNGGDETSADTAIYFKIYGSADSYTTPIATTGVHGTTGVSVSAGTATVTWEVGTETAFKVTQVDEAGNESLASAVYDTAVTTYGINFTAGQTEYLRDDLWRTEVAATDWEIKYTVNGTIPTTSTVSLLGNNMATTIDHMMIHESMITTGNLRFRVRESGSSSSTSTTEIAAPVDGDTVTIKRVGNVFTLIKNEGLAGEVSQGFTISTTWSNPTSGVGSLIIGDNIAADGAQESWGISNLVIRGETFLPTTQSSGTTLTSAESADTITVASAVSTTAMYTAL